MRNAIDLRKCQPITGHHKPQLKLETFLNSIGLIREEILWQKYF